MTDKGNKLNACSEEDEAEMNKHDCSYHEESFLYDFGTAAAHHYDCDLEWCGSNHASLQVVHLGATSGLTHPSFTSSVC